MLKKVTPEDLRRYLVVNPENGNANYLGDVLKGCLIYDIAEQEPEKKEDKQVQEEPKEEPKKRTRKKVKPNPDMQLNPEKPKKRWKVDRDEVCRLRNEQGFSIDELARRMECSTQTITNILTQLRAEGRLNECV
ncbi:MAG: HTH domain-containing protein [Clostridia bacterium]|nr:HTH domain-containing protein [Clostridia bacterium]